MQLFQKFISRFSQNLFSGFNAIGMVEDKNHSDTVAAVGMEDDSRIVDGRNAFFSAESCASLVNDAVAIVQNGG